MNVVNETVKGFSALNTGYPGSKELLSYCRPSVEKYIFTRLYDRLFAMYIVKYQDKDEKFVQKRASLKHIKGTEMMRKLDVPLSSTGVASEKMYCPQSRG